MRTRSGVKGGSGTDHRVEGGEALAGRVLGRRGHGGWTVRIVPSIVRRGRSRGRADIRGVSGQAGSLQLSKGNLYTACVHNLVDNASWRALSA